MNKKYLPIICAFLLSNAACSRTDVFSAMAAQSTSVIASFSYTGGQQTWTVPSGITKIRITAVGAAGGQISAGAAGAGGGMMTAEFSVTSGDTYYIYVGGCGWSGGWNGGGIDGNSNPCSYAGGAADIRFGGTSLTDRIMVTGGGGGLGANGANAGGYGAGLLNADGGAGTDSAEGLGGGGGTSAAGGSGGTGTFGASPAPSGTSGTGASNSSFGGAGGGGYYGGGSGGSGVSGGHGGGGGGSSYLNTSLGSFISGVNGYNTTADGSVIISDVSP